MYRTDEVSRFTGPLTWRFSTGATGDPGEHRSPAIHPLTRACDDAAYIGLHA
jgi:hypothetical protein